MQNNNRPGTPTNQGINNIEPRDPQRRRVARSRLNTTHIQNNTEISLSNSLIRLGGVRRNLIFSYPEEPTTLPTLNPTCKPGPTNRRDYDSNGPTGAICTGKMIPCGG